MNKLLEKKMVIDSLNTINNEIMLTVEEVKLLNSQVNRDLTAIVVKLSYIKELRNCRSTIGSRK